MVQGDIDQHHAKFPWQAGIGTEESNTIGTRGIYETNSARCHLAPTNRMPENVGTESGWKFYEARPFLSGIFFWTGFDYRGEPSPYGWPAVTSQYGIVDLCGFPKDIFYYLKSWWGDKPVLHIAAHWNWPEDSEKEKSIKVYSNCDEVELFLNEESLGKKQMEVNGHLEWKVNYSPGVLKAVGSDEGEVIITRKVETTGIPNKIDMHTDNANLKADGKDVSVITILVKDSEGRIVPTAMNELAFGLEGPARILGVGNGDPASHEKERYFETIEVAPIVDLKEKTVKNLTNRPETADGYDDSGWIPALQKQEDWQVYEDTLLVIRGSFDLPEFSDETVINLFTKSIVDQQSIFVNGHNIAERLKRDAPGQSYQLDHSILNKGKNEYAVTGQKFRLAHRWDEPNTDPGLVQLIYPVETWQRKAFNGLAQVIVQSDGEEGKILLKATSPGLKDKTIELIAAD